MAQREKSLRDQTYETLMRAVAELVPGQTGPSALRELAEAYAWLVNPNQPHGGGAGT